MGCSVIRRRELREPAYNQCSADEYISAVVGSRKFAYRGRAQPWCVDAYCKFHMELHDISIRSIARYINTLVHDVEPTHG
ncbi:hypothetical protein PBRA_004287 [Plasmodiophora brassicae]|uniref:Uncharacterized protein n=1 Tax=Plasmodiophora brassicae TaxID=37360 RepID=A0A0G4IK29_PLABS|nr:hypothetical protein PBRA_004287 [Plasmodiophora brassicae]